MNSRFMRGKLDLVQETTLRNWEYEWHSRSAKIGILQNKRSDSRLIMLYTGLKDTISTLTDDLSSQFGMSGSINSLAFQISFANTNI